MIQEVKKAIINNDDQSIELGKKTASNYTLEKEAEKNEDYSLIVKSDEKLEEIIQDIRLNPEKKSNERYKSIFNLVMRNNSEEIVTLKKEVAKEKESIYKKLSNEKTYSASIKDSYQLRTNYTEVFGKQRDEISFDDYVALLELKKLLDIDEQIAISRVEKA